MTRHGCSQRSWLGPVRLSGKMWRGGTACERKVLVVEEMRGGPLENPLRDDTRWKPAQWPTQRLFHAYASGWPVIPFFCHQK